MMPISLPLLVPLVEVILGCGALSAIRSVWYKFDIRSVEKKYFEFAHLEDNVSDSKRATEYDRIAMIGGNMT